MTWSSSVQTLMSLVATDMENNTYAMPHSIVSSEIYNPYGGMQWYLQQSHRRHAHWFGGVDIDPE